MPACRDCGKEIIWCNTARGANFALDAPPPIVLGRTPEPSPGRRLFVLVKGVATLQTEEDKRLARPTYTCHWDTDSGCPGIPF